MAKGLAYLTGAEGQELMEVKVGCCGFAVSQKQYFRLHGITGYSYHYTDADLERLEGWARQKPSYVLFNNISMSEDAQRFLRRVRGK